MCVFGWYECMDLWRYSWVSKHWSDYDMVIFMWTCSRCFFRTARIVPPCLKYPTCSSKFRAGNLTLKCLGLWFLMFETNPKNNKVGYLTDLRALHHYCTWWSKKDIKKCELWPYGYALSGVFCGDLCFSSWAFGSETYMCGYFDCGMNPCSRIITRLPEENI